MAGHLKPDLGANLFHSSFSLPVFCLGCLIPVVASAQAVASPQSSVAEAASSSDSADPGSIVVTASRTNMVGVATTASEGRLTREEIELRPIFRPGQLFESIPGLVVTIHSGEGKANQYLIRGYNLDHGTDFANFVDDMPVNRPTNAHGQGYSDVAFLMPQIVSGIDFTKGPYHAAIGDFGSVASSHVSIANELPAQISASVGTLGEQRIFMGGSVALSAQQHLLGAAELSHFDGPWEPGQDFRKINAALRYSQGGPSDGFSIMGMFYKSSGLLTTDQPLRAIETGLISRFGTLDPSDASRSLRYSLSAHLDKPIESGQLSISLYGIRSTMTLWNDFTHFLLDPVNGDQQKQSERRTTLGGVGAYAASMNFGSIDSKTTVGLQVRRDLIEVDRQRTEHRTTILDHCEFEEQGGNVTTYPAVDGYCNADRVNLLDVALYFQNTTLWTHWLRSVIGAREEFYHASDVSSVTAARGVGHQWLFQPKVSVVLGPWASTEFYLSYGRGFHSDDVRGVFGTVPERGIPLAGGPTPLLAMTTGAELGIRSNVTRKLSVQLAIFQQDFRSELSYNADAGQDEAGAPSRRQGLELSAQYRPARWIEFNTDLAFSRPRYRSSNLAAYDLAGSYIADAPNFIGSAGILIDKLGPWNGGLQWRRLGAHPLVDGEHDPRSNGYSEFNLDVGYNASSHMKFQVSIFNVLNSRDNAAEYFYTSRLPGEPAQGVEGFQVHPLEPRSVRFTITRSL
jgi:outer membrane receptor protein involved in Fe transport